MSWGCEVLGEGGGLGEGLARVKCCQGPGRKCVTVSFAILYSVPMAWYTRP